MKAPTSSVASRIEARLGEQRLVDTSAGTRSGRADSPTTCLATSSPPRWACAGCPTPTARSRWERCSPATPARVTRFPTSCTRGQGRTGPCTRCYCVCVQVPVDWITGLDRDVGVLRLVGGDDLLHPRLDSGDFLVSEPPHRQCHVAGLRDVVVAARGQTMPMERCRFRHSSSGTAAAACSRHCDNERCHNEDDDPQRLQPPHF